MGTVINLVISLTRIFITSTRVVRLEARRKAARPEHISQPLPQSVCVILRQSVLVMVRCRQPNLGTTNPVCLLHGSPGLGLSCLVMLKEAVQRPVIR
jgi:hypothetical protein